jgi:hypothetical protein
LGVRGHYLESSKWLEMCSVTELTGNCDETHTERKSIASSYYET